MKQTLILMLLFLALVLPLTLTWAQEEADTPQTQSAAPAEKTPGAAAPGTAVPTLPNVDGLINKILALLAPIGALFGKTAGIRIGGTTGTGIAALVIAKLVEDKTPSWVKWVLYLTGGTMFAGGGANVAQLVMNYLPQ